MRKVMSHNFLCCFPKVKVVRKLSLFMCWACALLPCEAKNYCTNLSNTVSYWDFSRNKASRFQSMQAQWTWLLMLAHNWEFTAREKCCSPANQSAPVTCFFLTWLAVNYGKKVSAFGKLVASMPERVLFCTLISAARNLTVCLVFSSL